MSKVSCLWKQPDACGDQAQTTDPMILTITKSNAQTLKPQHQHANSPHWPPYVSHDISWKKLFKHPNNSYLVIISFQFSRPVRHIM